MAYTDSYGVKFSDNRKILVHCPKDFKGVYTIPNSVTSIGESAFQNCSSLTGIIIPNSIKRIGDAAFDYCKGLVSITIPDSVTKISKTTFRGCSNLTEINVSSDNAVYASDKGVLFDKQKTILICYPSGKVGSYSIPDGVTSIGNVFYDCKGLISITIPDSVTKIGKSAFRGCSSLTEINVASDNTIYASDKGVLFNKQKTILIRYPLGKVGSYSIPDGVTSIGNIFSDCSTLTSITIPNSVTKIGKSAFGGCSSLTEINVVSDNTVYASDKGVLFNKQKTILICYPSGKVGSYSIPDSVMSIEEVAFYDCKGLVSVTISNNVTKIGEWAFGGCSSLTEINVASDNTIYASDKGVLFNKQKTVLIACPAGKVGNYSIPDGVMSIGDAFYGCSGLVSITISDSVTEIEEWAFHGCSSLINITIPNSVKKIGNSAFSHCSSLTSIIIPNSVREIGEWAFDRCSSLISIIIPRSVTKIGSFAFNECPNLKEICIPKGTTAKFMSGSFRNLLVEKDI